MGEGLAIPIDPQHTPTFIQSSTSQPQKTQTPRELTSMDTEIPQSSGPTKHVADEAVHKERGDSLVRAATTASSLEAEQVSGSGPRCQETMGDAIAQTRFESVSKHSNDLLLARGNTLQSDEDRLNLTELMELCTNLQQRVLGLEDKLKQTKTTHNHEMFDVGIVTGDEVFAEQEVSAKDVNLTVDEVTLAQALAALNSVKPKVKGDVIEEPSVPVSVFSASTKVSATVLQQRIVLLQQQLLQFQLQLQGKEMLLLSWVHLQ
ncbi:hypothetical protein Tco_1479227 [Tanacetum coccineum]